MTHSPLSPEQFSPPNGVSINQLEVDQHHLMKGDSMVLATNTEILPIDVLGIDGLNPRTENEYTVVGHIIGPDKLEDEVGSQLDTYVVRHQEPSGAETFFLTFTRNNEDGSSRTVLGTELKAGVAFRIGRATAESITDPTHIDGRDLNGTEFSPGISRQHVQLEIVAEGIKITDTSTNGTTIEGDKVPRYRPKSGSAVVALSVEPIESENIVDKVPATAEEARRALDEEEERNRLNVLNR
jgi:pSer/pThr/pTyr-binding forkhead associated (FHA) protein